MGGTRALWLDCKDWGWGLEVPYVLWEWLEIDVGKGHLTVLKCDWVPTNVTEIWKQKMAGASRGQVQLPEFTLVCPRDFLLRFFGSAHCVWPRFILSPPYSHSGLPERTVI